MHVDHDLQLDLVLDFDEHELLVDQQQLDDRACGAVVFSYSVSPGRRDYPLLSVTVTAPNGVPKGCERSWSLNSYTAEGPTWETSGTQALFDHDSITLDDEHASGTLTVAAPPCYGQTDFYEGTTRFDGDDGPLPLYPGSVVPNPGLIAYSNGGTLVHDDHDIDHARRRPSRRPSRPRSRRPSRPRPVDDAVDDRVDHAVDDRSRRPSRPRSRRPVDDRVDHRSRQPDGGVGGATATPRITPPPTSTLPTSGTPSGDTWRVALLAIAGLLATLLLLAPATPATARRRR